jgi:D-tyrosyl-tRNA(Tyr) deacylase
MRVLLQRVSKARVHIDGTVRGEIGKGLLVLLGISYADTQAEVAALVKKMLSLRIFSDEAGKMNLSLLDIGGEVLVVSQFTLYANTRKGKRPSFMEAARPEQAIPLYEHTLQLLEQELGKPVAKGVFGADMQVELVNDGPVTIWLDSNQPLDAG